MVDENEFSDAFGPAFDANVIGLPSLDAPCNWPVDYSACGGKPEALTSLPASGAVFEEMAATYLWNWTGRKYGLCEVELRPCRQDCWEGQSTFWGGSGGARSTPYYPVIIRGAWTNISCGRCGDGCSCDGTPALRLPGPVHSIANIIIDGATLDSSAYRVDNDRLVVRTDGGEWPTCQNMSAAAGEADTWSILYNRGYPVPAGGQVAAGVLAVELAKAACGDKSCGLPQRVQSITRQGVTIAVLDAFDDIDTGHTGIWLIDSWVASVVRRPRRMRVYSPDRMPPRARRQTWPV